MKTKIYTCFFACLLCFSVYANNGIFVEYCNDTLFVSCAIDSLPKHLVIAGRDGVNTYKRIVNEAVDTLVSDHPADDIYKAIWTSEKVNPYAMPIDSLPDSIAVSLEGFVMPHKGYITSKFGLRKYRYHYGTDIKVQTGDTILCAWNGQVRIVRYDPKGYGNFVVVRHDNGLETIYGHLSRVLVEENERIMAGEIIGLGGNTGRSTGSHLHLETRYLGNAINPETLIDFDKHELKEEQYLITKKKTFYYHAQLKEMQAAKWHVVKSGENLSILAKRYGTTVSAICKLNGISSNSVIRIGQKLRVR